MHFRSGPALNLNIIHLFMWWHLEKGTQWQCQAGCRNSTEAEASTGASQRLLARLAGSIHLSDRGVPRPLMSSGLLGFRQPRLASICTLTTEALNIGQSYTCMYIKAKHGACPGVWAAHCDYSLGQAPTGVPHTLNGLL